jgi:hypothetical protein
VTAALTRRGTNFGGSGDNPGFADLLDAEAAVRGAVI